MKTAKGGSKKYFQVAEEAPSFTSVIHNCLTIKNYEKPDRSLFASFLVLRSFKIFLTR